ncbi:hypothetical protein [Adhaeribacter arboris]|nr:hypothetical protein [Adhaeribacter arboris]
MSKNKGNNSNKKVPNPVGNKAVSDYQASKTILPKDEILPKKKGKSS